MCMPSFHLYKMNNAHLLYGVIGEASKTIAKVSEQEMIVRQTSYMLLETLDYLYWKYGIRWIHKGRACGWQSVLGILINLFVTNGERFIVDSFANDNSDIVSDIIILYQICLRCRFAPMIVFQGLMLLYFVFCPMSWLLYLVILLEQKIFVSEMLRPTAVNIFCFFDSRVQQGLLLATSWCEYFCISSEVYYMAVNIFDFCHVHAFNSTYGCQYFH